MRAQNVFYLIAITLTYAGYSLAQCDYELVWEDDFSGTSLNLENWEYQIGGNGWGNNELQSYTSSNAIVSGGTLQIIADEPTANNYESSRIRSKNLYDLKYGKVEARIKLPEGQGIWPAFWMLPTCQVYGTWPSSGEIDIMEYLGHQTNRVYTTCHYGDSPTDKGQTGNSYTLPTGTFSDSFHVFAIEWSENSISWTIDDQVILEIDQSDVGQFVYPFNEDFHLLLNVAVGGNWPGDPDASTIFPQVMEVDYVKAFQLIEDWSIYGQSQLLPNSQAVYTVPFDTGSTYDWLIPSCATIVSGQGTNEILVNWGTESGDIGVVIGHDCQTIYREFHVELSSNLLINGDFEKNLSGWYANFFNGGWGSFYSEDTNGYNNSRYACIDVSSLGDNFWDVQLGNQELSVLNGQELTLNFYARADLSNRQMRIDFRDGSNNSSQGNQTFMISNTWVAYSYTFVAPDDIAELYIDFNHGFEEGTYCYDDITLSVNGVSVTDCEYLECIDVLQLNDSPIEEGHYHANTTLQSQSMINTTDVEFTSDGVIHLESGFMVQSGSNFSAKIQDCDGQ